MTLNGNLRVHCMYLNFTLNFTRAIDFTKKEKKTFANLFLDKKLNFMKTKSRWKAQKPIQRNLDKLKLTEIEFGLDFCDEMFRQKSSANSTTFQKKLLRKLSPNFVHFSFPRSFYRRMSLIFLKISLFSVPRLKTIIQLRLFRQSIICLRIIKNISWSINRMQFFWTFMTITVIYVRLCRKPCSASAAPTNFYKGRHEPKILRSPKHLWKENA